MHSLIRGLLRRMKLVFGRKPEDATAIFLKKILPDCPICGTSTQNHEYALVCSGEFHRELINELSNLLEKKRIRELIENFLLNPWNPSNDGIDLFAIECTSSSGDRISLILVLNPLSLYENYDFIVMNEVPKSELMQTTHSLDLNIHFKPL